MEINITHTVIHTIKMDGTTALILIGGAILLLIAAACVFHPMNTPSLVLEPQEEAPIKAPMGFVQ